MQLELGTQSLDALAAAAGFGGRSPDTGITVQNATGRIVAACAQAELILGLPIDELRGRTSLDPRWAAVDESGEPVPGVLHPATQALTTGSASHGLVMGVHRPGSDAPGHHVWLDVSAVPLKRPDDIQPWVVVIALRPITGDRLRSLQLHDSERVYRMIAEHSSDMVAWQLLASSRVLWVSPASRALLGVDPDELVGVRVVDLVHPEDRPHLRQWRAVANGIATRETTVRLRHADGSYRWVETTAHVLPSRGAPTQVITTHRDVTDRIAAERARDTAVQLFELAIKHATIGVALRTADGTLTQVNPAICAMLGRNAGELIGHDLADFAADPDDDVDLADVEAGRRPHHEVDRRFRRADGSILWCTRTDIALPAESGGVEHLLVQLQDVTVRKETSELLERAALTDALTGLPNRAALEDRLNHALATAQRTGRGVGVLFIDLDRFKWINDTLGHDIGDELLRAVGSRLAAAVRHTDTVVRLGGDEFVVVRECHSHTVELDDLAARIRELFAAPFIVSGRTLFVTASVGATSGHDVSARELLSRADDAMYRIKKRRRSRRDALRATVEFAFRRAMSLPRGR